jgi:hypothetical protein
LLTSCYCQAEVTGKIRHINCELGGVDRVCLQMTVGPLPDRYRLATIERLACGTERLKLPIDRPPSADGSDPNL